LAENNLFTLNPFKEAEDKLNFAKVLDKLSWSQKNSKPAHTDFLDPASCAKFMQALERISHNNFVIANGGFENAERKIIFVDTSEGGGIPIAPIAITYNQRFAKPPTHRDYLGAILGLGIDRGKIGDICLADEGAIVYVIEDIADFIAENLCQVGRVTVKARARDLLDGLKNANTTKQLTVASMRLDAVLSSVFNLSRGKASQLIESEKVFVNWKLAKKTHILTVKDAITVRGMGRFTIDSQGGTNKKGRIALVVIVT